MRGNEKGEMLSQIRRDEAEMKLKVMGKLLEQKTNGSGNITNIQISFVL